MLPCYVLLDLETTGGTPLHSRITEIAAVRVEHGVEVARWSSLVNPGCSIPYFIQQLTGINDDMVQDAPRFDRVSAQLLQLLDGAVLVAHNVRFDHSFLLHEFERMGVTLRVKTLCTVRLSRKLYPQHKGHGLDAIMQRHGLSTMARHRAMGDVDVMQSWLRVATQELGAEQVQAQALASHYTRRVFVLRRGAAAAVRRQKRHTARARHVALSSRQHPAARDAHCARNQTHRMARNRWRAGRAAAGGALGERTAASV